MEESIAVLEQWKMELTTAWQSKTTTPEQLARHVERYKEQFALLTNRYTVLQAMEGQLNQWDQAIRNGGQDPSVRRQIG